MEPRVGPDLERSRPDIPGEHQPSLPFPRPRGRRQNVWFAAGNMRGTLSSRIKRGSASNAPIHTTPPVTMDREKLGGWLGIVVFALGIALLAFTFYSAFMLATNPNGIVQKQLGDGPVRAEAFVSVGLTFSPNPVNVDTQMQGTITISGGSTPFS